VLASRLGYRITAAFVDRFLGRIFEMPGAVFPEELLRPEKQDLGVFVAGRRSHLRSAAGVALNYFEDGSVEAACPPIKALLHIMALGITKGREVTRDPAIRAMFTREALLASDWYLGRSVVGPGYRTEDRVTDPDRTAEVSRGRNRHGSAEGPNGPRKGLMGVASKRCDS
jgi:hypothetical protein